MGIKLFPFDTATADLNDLIDKIIKANAEDIILFEHTENSLKLISRMRQRKMMLTVFGSFSLVDENKLTEQELKNLGDIVMISSGHLPGSKGLAFRREFQQKYGNTPGIEAFFAFDGMNLLIEAIRDVGLDREKIQKSMAKMRYEGVTGPIQFDSKGNRMGAVGLMEFKNGIPTAIKK
jgi:branched-chain amino acid transport system substrate-binding protein